MKTLPIQFCLLCVFWVHNNAEYPYKIVSFLALYFLKITIFIVGIDIIFEPALLSFIVISVFFNISYLPKYIFRKSNTDFQIQKFFVQPIIWKNILLAVLIPFWQEAIIVLIFTDIITVLEFLIGKFFMNKKYGFQT